MFRFTAACDELNTHIGRENRMGEDTYWEIVTHNGESTWSIWKKQTLTLTLNELTSGIK